MLLDRVNRSLFTGDTFYPDYLFAFIDDDYGGSNLQIYEETMIELSKLEPDLDYLFCSHSKPLNDPVLLSSQQRHSLQWGVGKPIIKSMNCME